MKKQRNYKFDPETIDGLTRLKKLYGIENETRILENLVREACENLEREKREEEIKNLTIPDFIDLLSENGLRLEAKENMLLMNGRLTNVIAAYLPIRSKLWELNFRGKTMGEFDVFSKKMVGEMIEHLIPGHLQQWNYNTTQLIQFDHGGKS